MDFRKQLAKELKIGKIAEETMLDNYVTACETIAKKYHLQQDDAIHFAEWMDIVCIRDGRFDWKYQADNYTKKHTTKEMFTEWLKLTSNET